MKSDKNHPFVSGLLLQSRKHTMKIKIVCLHLAVVAECGCIQHHTVFLRYLQTLSDTTLQQRSIAVKIIITRKTRLPYCSTFRNPKGILQHLRVVFRHGDKYIGQCRMHFAHSYVAVRNNGIGLCTLAPGLSMRNINECLSWTFPYRIQSLRIVDHDSGCGEFIDRTDTVIFHFPDEGWYFISHVVN